MTITDTESPPAYPVMNNMNFNSKEVNSVLLNLNWATADEDYQPSQSHILHVLKTHQTNVCSCPPFRTTSG